MKMRKTWLKKTVICILASVLTTSIVSSYLPMQTIAREGNEQQIETIHTDENKEKATVTITKEDQLLPYFPDANFRKAVFHAVSDGQDNAEGKDFVDALANFTGDVSAKNKGIVDVHGIELLRKANKVDLTNNLITDFSFLGVNNHHDTYEEWYGVEESESEDRDQGRNVYWILDKNPYEFLPSDFGGRLVIKQAATTAFHYADDIGTLYKYVRNNTENGSVSGIINTNKTKMVFPDGSKTDANIISVADPKINGYDRIAITYDANTDKGYAKFSDLARSSSIVKISVGLDEVITYWTTDEWGTNTPGSQSFKYYITERFQVYDKITVVDQYDGSVKLTKVDKEDNTVTLSGAAFQLYNADGTRFDNNTYTSDASGIIEVKGLALGEYYFKETKAPDGYILSNDTFKFTITKPMDITTSLGGGLKEVTPTDATTPITAFDNERFMVGPNKIDEASPDITLTKGNNAVIKNVSLTYTYDDETNKETKIIDEVYPSLEAATQRINEIKNNNQLLGEVKVIVQHDAIADNGKTQITATNEKIVLKDMKVEKIWKDHSGWHGTHPDITIRLYQDNTQIDHVTLSHGNTQHIFTDLPTKNAQGNEIVYSVSEDPVVSQEGILGYTATIEETADGFTITNEWTIDDEFHIKGTKIWNDFDNVFNVRPTSIDIVLKQNGKPIQRKSISKENNWMFDFNNIPLYSSVDTPYTYTLEEDLHGENYIPLDSIVVHTEGLEHLSEVEISITNTLSEDVNNIISITGTKTWNDYNNAFHLRPTSIDVELLQNDVVLTTKTVSANKQNEWTYAFDKLAKFDKDGKEYVYTINEKNIVDNYTLTLSEHNLINTLDPTINETSIYVEKTWVDFHNALDTRPDSIEVILLQNGKEFKTTSLSKDSKTPWKAVFSELPNYADDGTAFVYTVKEADIPSGYSEYVEKSKDTFTLTNTLDKQLNDSVSIHVKKVWIDEGNEQNRPDHLTISLKQDGLIIQTIILNDRNHWEVTIHGLAKYKEDGKTYEYSVEEVDVKNYKQSDISVKQDDRGQWSYTFTNTFITPEEPETPDTPVKPEDPKTPNTGDTTQPILFLGLLILSSCTMAVVINKKHKKSYKI